MTISVFRNLDLKSRIAVFTVALFIGTIWLLVHDLEDEVRDNFREVLAAQQFYTAEHIASGLDAAVVLRINALADAAATIDPAWMSSPQQLHRFLAAQAPLYRFSTWGFSSSRRKASGWRTSPICRDAKAPAFPTGISSAAS